MNARLRARRGAPIAILAGLCYVPLLLTHPDKVGADTKTYLYLDPNRLLERAPSMWDPHIGLGTVTHQNIGYLWPMGPFYWLFDHLGSPDWVAQRIWLGSIMFFAGLGVRYLLRTLGQEGPQITASMYLYAFSPYVLTLGSRLSVILLCFTGLPWLLALTVRAVREGSWLHPALMALLITTIGSTNATALALVGIAPLLWLPFAVLVQREATWRAVAGAVGRIGLLTLGCSLWWMAGLWAQGAFGIDILRYTETARTVSEGSTAPEVLRGLGYWFFYGNDKYGAWVSPSRTYTQNPLVITLSYALPILALLATTAIRWRYRAYFAALIAVGTIVAVGAHPWKEPTPFSGAMKEFLSTEAGFAMRSLPRVVPLVALGTSVMLGAGIAAVGARWRSLLRPLAAGFAVLAVLNMPPLWQGQLVDNHLQRDEDLPGYWLEAAQWLDSRDTTATGYRTRVLEVPGSDFASYRWGNTVDPVTPGILDRPYIARELIPYGSPASAALINAIDGRLQTGLLEPAAVAPLARLISAGDVVLRGDLTYERYHLARPRQVYDVLRHAAGLSEPRGFGSKAPNVPVPDLPMHDELELASPLDLPNPWKVTVFPVTGTPSLVRLVSADSPVLVDGDAEGLVDLAQAGLIRGDEVLLFAASLAEDKGALQRELARDGSVLVLTDSNRRAGWRWSTMYDNQGFTEESGLEPLRKDPTNNPLPVFPEAGDSARSVVEYGTGVRVQATSYGNPVTFTPDNRAALALDDDLESEWGAAGFSDPRGEKLIVDYDEPRTTDQIKLIQADNGVQNRWITKVRIRLDDHQPLDVDLGLESRKAPGQVVRLPETTSFKRMTLEILADDVGPQDDYAGLSEVGFSDVRLGHDDVRVDEVVRLPEILTTAAGERSIDHPMVISLNRLRVNDTLPLRIDPEADLRRQFELPTSRSFTVTGQARVDFAADEPTLDALFGLAPAQDGGVTATSNRRLAGDVMVRASSAIDGDPSTHWSPGFLEQEGDWLRYRRTEPLSFDHLDMQVLADGWHTVPTRIRIESKGHEPVEADIPAVTDGDHRGDVRSVRVDLPSTVTGTDIRISFPKVREVTTPDWIWGQDIVMPVGIAELGIPGLSVSPTAEPFDSGCRQDLLTVDGEPVGVRATGSREDVAEGRGLDLTTCDGQPLALDKGDTVVRTVDGRKAGISIERLVLRSEAGGGAAPDPGAPMVPAIQEPPLRVDSQGMTDLSLTLPARRGASWLILGQSHNLGWHATLDGRDLGEPTLVSGYGNGWLLPPDADGSSLKLEWVPQRTVRWALLLSLVAAIVCAAIVVVGVRRRVGKVAAPRSGDQPAPFDPTRLWRSSGAPPSLLASAVTAVLAALAGVVFVGWPAGVAMAAIALAVTRIRRARALTVFGPPLLLAVSASYVLYLQVRHQMPAGFSWPSFFHKLEAPGYVAVLVLVLEIFVERLWSGRFSPDRPITDGSR